MKNKKSPRYELFKIISIGNKSDPASRIFDIALVLVIFVNLTVTLLSTFEQCRPYAGTLETIEAVTIVLFTIEYILRLLTADYLFPDKTRPLAIFAFVLSFSGLIDLLTFLPFYLPFFFPAGAVAFRMLRVIRIFRLFRVNAQNDAFSVIVDVLYEKRSQLLFSVVLILIFMIAASLCMYDLEHEAQPDAFKNAFSGIWWSVSTLLTVGYGDIYPVTTAGQIMAIIISFLGVGMVAIPTGIISAGFVQQYTRRKSNLRYGKEHSLQFVTSKIPAGHPYEGKRVGEIILPPQCSVSLILRGSRKMIPDADTLLLAGDTVIIGSSHYRESAGTNIREIFVQAGNEWAGKKIGELSLQSEEEVIGLRREAQALAAEPDATIEAGDTVVLYNS